MALRQYANAPATALNGGITALATSLTVDSITGLPVTYPFIIIVDRGTPSEEVALVTAGAGANLTVTRGYDSTTAFSHADGAIVEHGISAIDPREANAHVNATSSVHGVTTIVGTTDSQTLTNKTISADTNTLSGIAASSFVVSNGSGNIDGAAAQKVIPAGAVVGTTDSQTLTTKTISADDNTLSGVAASSFVLSNGSGNIDGSAAAKAIPTGVVVGTTDSQTLTNKTLTSPTITGPGATTGIVKLVDQGRLVSAGVQDDDELVITLAVGTWVFDVFIIGVADNTGQDLNFNMTFGGTQTFIRYGVVGAEVGMTTTSSTLMRLSVGTNSGDNIPVGLNASNTTIRVTGSIVVTGSGTLKLRWGANSGLSAEQVNVMKGSHLRALRVV